MLSTIPFKISTVSIPVVPRTPGDIALTGLVPSSQKASEVVTKELKKIINIHTDKQGDILVVGLGNIVTFSFSFISSSVLLIPSICFKLFTF